MGEKQLTFAGLETKYIRLENKSLSTPAELGESLIEEKGKKEEGTFAVTAGKESGGIPACKSPTPGQKLEKNGDACIVGVQLLKNVAAKATFVIFFGAQGGSQKEAKAEMAVER